MRIVQITDMHCGGDGRFSAGVDVDANYERAMQFIRSVEPDWIICTGDLVCTASDTPTRAFES